jgi:hypothetical protein
MIPAGARIRKHHQVVYRDLKQGEGGVLLHLESGQYHGVNAIGSLIWDLIDGSRTQTDLQAALRSRVSNPPDHLDDDVTQFLEKLRERDLIVLSMD